MDGNAWLALKLSAAACGHVGGLGHQSHRHWYRKLLSRGWCGEGVAAKTATD